MLDDLERAVSRGLMQPLRAQNLLIKIMQHESCEGYDGRISMDMLPLQH